MGDNDPAKSRRLSARMLRLRLLAVVLCTWAGFAGWSVRPLRQLGYGFSYAALVFVSLAISLAFWFAVVNVGTAAAWLFLHPQRFPRAYRHVHQINRRLGHFGLFFPWLILVLAIWPYLYIQLPLAGAVLLFWEPVVNTLTRALFGEAAQGNGLYAQRRLVIYAGTMLGLVGLALVAPLQVQTIMPLLLAVGAGALVRTAAVLRHRPIGDREERKEEQEPADGVDRKRRVRRKRWALAENSSLAARNDWLVAAVFATVLVVTGVWAILYPAHQVSKAAKQAQEHPQPRCAVSEPATSAPPVSLFLVADTQLHELRGPRFHGQMELFETLVPVAIRPVELDLLAGPTLLHFGAIHQQLAGGRPLPWAVLGDLADLACRGEIERFRPLFGSLRKAGPLAGLSPGNHDCTFTGNFRWHPDWDLVCPSGRADKWLADQDLYRLSAPLVDGARAIRHDRGRSFTSLWAHKRSALFFVSPLGVVPVEVPGKSASRRGVIGIFFDTTDQSGFDWGIAGLWGAISQDQIDVIRAHVDQLRARPDFADPAFVFFFHHPFGDLELSSRQRVRRLAEALDGGRPRVLALVSAHTHDSEQKSHCFGDRRMRELIVGSTTDPPQEAAELTVGARGDQLVLRARTLPAVAVDGKTCPSPQPAGPIPGATCERVRTELLATEECRELLQGQDQRPCAELRRVALDDASDAPDRPETPGQIREQQWARADRLFTCLCRGGRCQPPADPLDDRWSARILEKLAGDETARTEMVCLSWAASLVQRYKLEGIGLADAARCAYGKDALPFAASEEIVATVDERCSTGP